MEKPKALIVASVASMIQQFNMPNIKLLQEMGYEVHVACNFIDSGTIPSIQTEELIFRLQNSNAVHHQIDFSRNILNLISNVKAHRQMKEIMKNNYSLVHSHSPIGGVVARLTANKYRKNGLKSIYTAHGFHFYKGSSIIAWFIFYPIEKILSNFTDVLITINNEDYTMAKNKKFRAKKIEYLPGVGVNLKKYSSAVEPIKLLKSFGITCNDFVLTYVAELNDNKNQILLLEIMKDLKTKISNCKLLLVGNGENKKNYQQFIVDYKLQESVQILGYRDDVEKILSITDVYVASSIREGLPVNVIEAQAAGLPIIATDNRGHRDLINSGNGILVELTDKNRFEESIVKLYNDRSLRNEMRFESLNSAKRYSTENIMEKYKRIIEEL